MKYILSLVIVVQLLVNGTATAGRPFYDNSQEVVAVETNDPAVLSRATSVKQATARKEANSSEPALPFLMPDTFADLQLVAWRVEQGEPDSNNPLVEPEMPWDLGSVFSHGTVLHDPLDGKWKAWQVSTPPKNILAGDTYDLDRRLTYLESDDGIHWRRPKLPFVSWQGHEQTNILLDLDSGGRASYASVNIVPERKNWPYEMFVLREPRHKNPSGKVGGLAPPRGKRAIYRYRSKEGTAWEVFEGPIHIAPSDSCYVYRRLDGSYFAYPKTGIPAFPGQNTSYDNGAGMIRVLEYFSSPDGSSWDENAWGGKKLMLYPDWRDPADLQFMELCPIALPGGYAGIVTAYHSLTQTIDLQWAVSRDGLNWWRPGRRPALPNPPLGDYGGGMIWPMHSPILEGNKLHVYYSGTEGIHCDLFSTTGRRSMPATGERLRVTTSGNIPMNSALCRATWTADRLWALVAAAGGATQGEASTHKSSLGGKRLWVNVRTRHHRAGLRVELLDDNGKVLPGFSREDCKLIVGDHHAVAVEWTGGGRAPAAAVQTRFVLLRAFLYGFDWRI